MPRRDRQRLRVTRVPACRCRSASEGRGATTADAPGPLSGTIMTLVRIRSTSGRTSSMATAKPAELLYRPERRHADHAAVPIEQRAAAVARVR